MYPIPINSGIAPSREGSEMGDYETAKARVEAGDLRFEAVAGMCVAHGEKLVRDYERADRPRPILNSESAYDYVERHYAGCDLPDDCDLRITFGTAPDFGVPSMRLQATYRNARGVTCIDLWDVWVEGGALYGEC